MKNIEEVKPKNMTRLLIAHKYTGILEFAYYKDGMFKCDSGEVWITPRAIKSWMQIDELKLKEGL